MDRWAKELAPSDAVRKAFGHRPEAFGEFRRSYRAELEAGEAGLRFAEECEQALRTGNVTLVYAARSAEENNAAVLCGWLREKIRDLKG